MTTTDQTIALVHSYAHPPEVVFRAWTNSTILRSWYAPVEGWIVGSSAVTPGVGGGYSITFGPPPTGDEYREEGTYTIFEPPHRLEWDGILTDDVPESSHVAITITATDAGSELTLMESRIENSDTAAEHEDGWATALTQLQFACTLPE